MLASMYDASLDQFKPHQWSKPDLFPVNYLQSNWNGGGFTTINTWEKRWEKESLITFEKEYDELNSFDIEYDNPRHMKMKTEAVVLAAPAPMQDEALNEVVVTGVADSTSTTKEEEKKSVPESGDIQVRKNFSETAFFFPDLKTDAEGKLNFKVVAKWLLNIA